MTTNQGMYMKKYLWTNERDELLVNFLTRRPQLLTEDQVKKRQSTGELKPHVKYKKYIMMEEV